MYNVNFFIFKNIQNTPKKQLSFDFVSTSHCVHISMLLKVMPVQSPGGLANFIAKIAWVTIRVWQMLCLNMIEDSQLAVVGELAADAALVLAIHVGQVAGQGAAQIACKICFQENVT